MGDPSRLRDRCAIAGIGLSRFGKLPGTSTMGFTLEAAKRAIDDAGIARDEIDGVLALMPAVMGEQHGWASRVDRKSTRLNSSHMVQSRMPSSA